MRHVALIVAGLWLTPVTAYAQGIGAKIVNIFSAPVHPIVRSIGPRGRFGPGIVYQPTRRANEPWSLRLEGTVTPRRYWNLQGGFEYTTERVHAEAYVRAREMTRLDFYGLGRESHLADRSSFRFADRTGGVLASVPFRVSRLGIRIGGRAEAIDPEVGGGKAPGVPLIGQAFSDREAPGLLRQPHFAAYSGFAIVQFPDDLNQLARLGVDVRASVTTFNDLDGRDFDFRRVTLEAQQRVAGFRETDKLTLHQLYSGATAGSGSRVPFYLQETLGGVGDVRSFNDEIVGSDSTTATLRGFRDLRFRGPQLVLLQAEYRFKVVGPIDATVFADAGAIALRRADLERARFARSYGFSLSVMTIDATAVRMDVGFGGSEGAHVFFSVGPIFRQ
jgi:hypothetical protein